MGVRDDCGVDRETARPVLVQVRRDRRGRQRLYQVSGIGAGLSVSFLFLTLYLLEGVNVCANICGIER